MVEPLAESRKHCKYSRRDFPHDVLHTEGKSSRRQHVVSVSPHGGKLTSPLPPPSLAHRQIRYDVLNKRNFWRNPMNDRATKTAYKNDIHIETIDLDIDDDLETTGTSNTTGKGLNGKRKQKKTKALPASTNANSNAKQQDDVPSTASHQVLTKFAKVQPQLRALDKAMIDAPATLEQVERAIDIGKELVRDSHATRITNQSKNWQAVFTVYLDAQLPAGHGQNPSVTLYFNYRGNARANIPFRLQFNPHKLNAQHTDLLIDLWKRIWPICWRGLRRDARYFRVDEAVDAAGDLDSLILDRKASQVTTRYCTQTGRDGKIKTSYVGEDSAANGGALYDRFSAEVFRNADCEPVPLNRETATHTLDQVKDVEGVIRVESRRVFATKLTYAELLQTPSAFSEFYLFDLSRLPPRDRRDVAFVGYTEIVRLRGMHGAKQRLLNMHGKTAETKRLIADYEQRLARAQCEWWTQLDRTQQLGKLLESLPANKFMKRIGS